MPAKMFYVFYLEVAIMFSYLFLNVNMCVYMYICIYKFPLKLFKEY